MNKKKIIFYLTFIPLIYAILSSIFCMFFGYSLSYPKEVVYGTEAFMEHFVSLWDLVLTESLVGIPCLGCFIYQVWYFISGREESSKKSIKEEEALFSKTRAKKTIFILSCSAWAAYFLYAIYAYFAGYNDGLLTTHWVYGFDAVKSALLWNLIGFSIIPILPASLIYIIIYLVTSKRNK